MPAETIAG